MPHSKEYLNKNKNRKMDEITSSTEKKLFDLQNNLYNADNTINREIYNQLFLTLKEYAKSIIIKKIATLSRQNQHIDIIDRERYLQYLEDKSLDTVILFINDTYIRKNNKPPKLIKTSFGGLLGLKVLYVLFHKKNEDKIFLNAEDIKLIPLEKEENYTNSNKSEGTSIFNEDIQNLLDNLYMICTTLCDTHQVNMDRELLYTISLLFLQSLIKYTRLGIMTKLEDIKTDTKFRKYYSALSKVFL